MIRINYLDIKYFKFFKKKKKIELEGKNILVFGENGSGKSTIYWAFYTFLQSSIKSNYDIAKYFTQSTTSKINEKSLVNIYESDDNKSYIKLNLTNNSNFCISKDVDAINTNDKSNTLISNANLASDFISYKYLFRFFNFLHREDIDLFPLFSYEILQFLSKDTNNMSELWNEILTLIDSKPRKNNKILNQKLTLFNNHLTEIISDLNIPIDNYLKQFKYNNLKLKLSVEEGTYNGKEFIYPKITLEIIIKKDDTNEIKIYKPQSYFNEAKLTAIALSVRLAITYNKLKNSELKILVLDDLLVSLDMSNRETVLNVITNDKYLKDYQIIILTHEKSFFEMAKRKLLFNWKYLEMYEDTSEVFPKPLILQSEDNFEKATKYFKKCDYPASGNYLRKTSEEIMKYLLSDIFKPSDKDGLDSLIKNLKTKYDEFKITIPESISKLEELTKRIFNPASHNDLINPLYKKEIDDAIQVVKELKDLKKIKSIDLSISQGSLLTFEYQEKYKVTYRFLDNIKLFEYQNEILESKNIFLGKCNYEILKDGVWIVNSQIDKKCSSLKEVYEKNKHFINKICKEEIIEDAFIDNLKIDDSFLCGTYKKLFIKQIS